MLSSYLKENTQQQHDLLEQKFNSDKIFGQSYSVEDYRRLIGLNYQFLQRYESKIRAGLSEEFKTLVNMDSRTKLPIIEQDATALNIHYSGDSETPEIASEAEAAGMLYVIEGASLGGNVIKKQLQKNPAFADTTFHYFGMYNENISAFWKSFMAGLNTYFTPENYPEVLKGAERAYAELLEYNG